MAAKKPPTKTTCIQLRVSVPDKRAMTRAAKKAGLGLSAWLRRLALRAVG